MDRRYPRSPLKEKNVWCEAHTNKWDVTRVVCCSNHILCSLHQLCCSLPGYAMASILDPSLMVKLWTNWCLAFLKTSQDPLPIIFEKRVHRSVCVLRQWVYFQSSVFEKMPNGSKARGDQDKGLGPSPQSDGVCFSKIVWKRTLGFQKLKRQTHLYLSPLVTYPSAGEAHRQVDGFLDLSIDSILEFQNKSFV